MLTKESGTRVARAGFARLALLAVVLGARDIEFLIKARVAVQRSCSKRRHVDIDRASHVVNGERIVKIDFHYSTSSGFEFSMLSSHSMTSSSVSPATALIVSGSVMIRLSGNRRGRGSPNFVMIMS